MDSSSLTIEHSSVVDNSALHGAGIDTYRSSIAISHSSISRNRAEYRGAGVKLYASSLTIEHSSISDNSAGQHGAGIWASASNTVTIRHTSISRNRARQVVHATRRSPHRQLRSPSPLSSPPPPPPPLPSPPRPSRFARLRAQDGGGLAFTGENFFDRGVGFFAFTNATFDSNVAGRRGQALWAEFFTRANSSLSNCAFLGHSDAASTLSISEPGLSWRCPLGQWMPTTGELTFNTATQGDCAGKCPAGRIGTSPYLTAADQCAVCPSGHYCARSGLTEGTPCPAGTRMPAVGASSMESCFPCGPGRFGNTSGKETCSPCAAGSFTAADKATACAYAELQLVPLVASRDPVLCSGLQVRIPFLQARRARAAATAQTREGRLPSSSGPAPWGRIAPHSESQAAPHAGLALPERIIPFRAAPSLLRALVASRASTVQRQEPAARARASAARCNLPPSAAAQ